MKVMEPMPGTTNGPPVQIGSASIGYAGTHTLSVTPHGTSVTLNLYIGSPFTSAPVGGMFSVDTIGYQTVTYTPGVATTTLCNEAADKYEFGFSDQYKDNEIAGIGNRLEFKFRGMDSRIGRFTSMDPLSNKYPWNSPYCYAENDVIRSVDIEGLEKYIVINKYDQKGSIASTTISTIYVNSIPNKLENFNMVNKVTNENYSTREALIVNDNNGTYEIDDNRITLTPREKNIYDHGRQIASSKLNTRTIFDIKRNGLLIQSQNPIEEKYTSSIKETTYSARGFGAGPPNRSNKMKLDIQKVFATNLNSMRMNERAQMTQGDVKIQGLTITFKSLEVEKAFKASVAEGIRQSRINVPVEYKIDNAINIDISVRAIIVPNQR